MKASDFYKQVEGKRGDDRVLSASVLAYSSQNGIVVLPKLSDCLAEALASSFNDMRTITVSGCPRTGSMHCSDARGTRHFAKAVRTMIRIHSFVGHSDKSRHIVSCRLRQSGGLERMQFNTEAQALGAFSYVARTISRMTEKRVQ